MIKISAMFYAKPSFSRFYVEETFEFGIIYELNQWLDFS